MELRYCKLNYIYRFRQSYYESFIEEFYQFFKNLNFGVGVCLSKGIDHAILDLVNDWNFFGGDKNDKIAFNVGEKAVSYVIETLPLPELNKSVEKYLQDKNIRCSYVGNDAVEFPHCLCTQNFGEERVKKTLVDCVQ